MHELSNVQTGTLRELQHLKQEIAFLKKKGGTKPIPDFFTETTVIKFRTGSGRCQRWTMGLGPGK